MKKWLWVLGAFIIIGFVTGKGAKKESATAPEAKAESQVSDGGTSKVECSSKVDQLQAKGIIKGFRSRDFTVVVDEATWRLIPYDIKLTMAKTIGCAAVGPGRYIPLTFRSNLSDRVLGEFSAWGLKVASF